MRLALSRTAPGTDAFVAPPMMVQGPPGPRSPVAAKIGAVISLARAKKAHPTASRTESFKRSRVPFGNVVASKAQAQRARSSVTVAIACLTFLHLLASLPTKRLPEQRRLS